MVAFILAGESSTVKVSSCFNLLSPDAFDSVFCFCEELMKESQKVRQEKVEMELKLKEHFEASSKEREEVSEKVNEKWKDYVMMLMTNE